MIGIIQFLGPSNKKSLLFERKKAGLSPAFFFCYR
jgi:hypothetical protein